MSAEPFGSAFTSSRQAALARLNHPAPLTRKAGSFLGQCAAEDRPLTAAQTEWLQGLLERADLPPFDGEVMR